MLPVYTTKSFKSAPVVTGALISVCLLVYLYQCTLSSAELTIFYDRYALVPARFTDGTWAASRDGARVGPLPFFTSLFLHGGLLHIALNVWTLWMFAPALEDELGKVRFLSLYVVSGIAAGIAHFIFNFNSAIPTVGASGAIAGVIGAYVRRFPFVWVNVLQPVGIMPVFLWMPAILFASVWFLIQMGQALGSVAGGSAGGVAWWAHIGGFICGWIIVKRLTPVTNPMAPGGFAAASILWPWKMWLRWMRWLWRGKM